MEPRTDPKGNQLGGNLEEKWKCNGFGIPSESVATQWGTHLEFVSNLFENVMDCLGMSVELRGCWGRSVESFTS